MQNDTALLVVDVQVGMFDGPDGLVHEGGRLLQKVDGLIRKARGAGVPVIYIQHSEGQGKSSKVAQAGGGYIPPSSLSLESL